MTSLCHHGMGRPAWYRQFAVAAVPGSIPFDSCPAFTKALKATRVPNVLFDHCEAEMKEIMLDSCWPHMAIRCGVECRIRGRWAEAANVRTRCQARCRLARQAGLAVLCQHPGLFWGQWKDYSVQLTAELGLLGKGVKNNKEKR